MARTLPRARELVDRLVAAGITATVDPATVHAQLPAVLVTPPLVRHDEGTLHGPMVEWRLYALVHGPAGLHAWEQLDELLDAVEDVLGVERAEPAQYALADTGTPSPAYLLTMTDYLEG